MPNRPIAFALIGPLSFAAVTWLAPLAGTCAAQEDAEAPVPVPRKKDGVQITFLPPPMRGVISLGIYDNAGKLARVLHREATEKAFVIGLNGLITKWDGKDDKGAALPPGKYSARGWTTGDLGIEGVAFHGNDWVKEDGPRFMEALRFQRGDGPGVNGFAAAGKWQVVLRSTDGQEHVVPVSAEEPALPAENTADRQLPATISEGQKVLKWTIGFGGNLWCITETATGREVQCYSQEGEFLRRLAYQQGEPLPFDLAASTAEERILLLEKNEAQQRFRMLGQPEVKGEASTWKTIEQKRIVNSDTFAAVAKDLGRSEPPKPEALVKLTSKLNPLLQNARADVQVQVVVAPDGAMLCTADGLPLVQLTDAKGLKWCALVPEAKSLTLFQSDGAVVEEFKIAKPDNLMSFDAGDYTLKK